MKRRPNRPPPRPAAQDPDDFDRMGWEVCRFANGSAKGQNQHTMHHGTCDCENKRVACCDSVRPTVEAILGILMRRR